MKSMLGKKIGMTQIFGEDGRIIPVTVIEAGPCRVVQVREADKDGYSALQLGFDEIRKKKNVSKAMLGHFTKSSLPAFRLLKEMKMEGFNLGDTITVELFSKGEKVSLTGTSKGKGFQGVMKRHHYAGGPASHGSMFYRAPGSIGSSSFPSRVWKNKGLPGHMGDEKATVKNIEVVEVKKEQNIMLVKGAVPGANGGYLIISKEG
ncbi:MAG: 50S ribosomal protein L3 [Nitrospirae bacterium]|nr:50S ribosomal protein L3 [Nitrospirota bacterium]